MDKNSLEGYLISKKLEYAYPSKMGSVLDLPISVIMRTDKLS
jgi:hypothetical protein